MNELNTRRGTVTIIPSCPVQILEKLRIDDGLGFFWHNRSDLQRQALLKIAAMPGGHVTVAHSQDQINVGYVTITPPEEDSRWGRDGIEGLLELGGIEVSRAWRGLGIGKALLAATFGGGQFDGNIVLATGYRWCWDMETTGLTVREYRNMVNDMFSRYGFQLYDTDEPNIAWYPDNALVVRVGPDAPQELIARFKALLFERPGSQYVPSEFSA